MQDLWPRVLLHLHDWGAAARTSRCLLAAARETDAAWTRAIDAEPFVAQVGAAAVPRLVARWRCATPLADMCFVLRNASKTSEGSAQRAAMLRLVPEQVFVSPRMVAQFGVPDDVVAHILRASVPMLLFGDSLDAAHWVSAESGPTEAMRRFLAEEVPAGTRVVRTSGVPHERVRELERCCSSPCTGTRGRTAGRRGGTDSTASGTATGSSGTPRGAAATSASPPC